MKIAKVFIKNFRSIGNEGITFSTKDFSILIGNNGTSKTTILEAINYCLSPHFLSSKIKQTDFHYGTDEEIEIKLTFDPTFKATLPDGYAKQEIECDGIVLKIKKRDRATPGKAFSEAFVVTHYANPNWPSQVR